MLHCRRPRSAAATPRQPSATMPSVADPATYTGDDGYHYTINGLSAKGGSLSSAQTTVDGLIHARRERANAVLQSASGPWAVDFREKEERVLSAMANAWFFLGYCSSACGTFPEPSYYGGSPTSIGNAIASKSQLAEPRGDGSDGTVAVELEALGSYITEAQGQHDANLAHLFDHVDMEGITGQKYPFPAGSPDWAPLLTEPLATPLTRGELEGQLTFLRHDPVDVTALSTDVLEFANDRKTDLTNAGNGDGSGNGDGGDGDGRDGGPDDVVPPVTDPPPTTEPPPAEPEPLPVLEALTLVAGRFTALDRPGTEGTPADGRLTRAELAAAAQDTTLPPPLRAAAAQLAANPELFAAVAVVNQPLVADPDGVLQFVTVDDVTTFLGSADAVAALDTHVDAVDRPGPDGQSPDGVITPDELQAAAGDPQLDPEAREAAAFLLDHPVVTQRLAHYDVLFPGDGGPIDPESLLLPPVLDPETGQPVVDPTTGLMQFEVAAFSSDNLERLAADHGELLGTGDGAAGPTPDGRVLRREMTVAERPVPSEPGVVV